MAILTMQQVKQLIDQRPANTTPQDVVNGLLQRGHQLEGFSNQTTNTDNPNPTPTNPTPPQDNQSIFGKVAGVINKGYEVYKNLPVIKQARQAVGAIVGGAGDVIGRTVGGGIEMGNQIIKAAQGDGFDNQQIAKAAEDTGKATSQFGKNIGSEGAAAAPLGLAGKAVNVAIAYSQGYQGLNDVVSGIKEGDVSKTIQGGVELGTAAYGAKGAVESKGILVNPEVVDGLKQLPDNLRAKAYNKVYDNTVQGYKEILNQTPKEFQNEIKFNKNTPEFLANEGIILKAENNKLNNTDAINTLKERADAVDNSLQDSLQSKNQKFDLFILGAKAKRAIEGDNSILAKDKIDAVNTIDDYIRAEADANGRFVTGVALNQFKRNLWSDSFSLDKSRVTNDTLFKIGHEAKNMIENVYDDQNIKGLNQDLGNYATAIRVLNKSNGRTIKGGKLTNLVYKGIGAIAGAATGSHFGALAGAELAGKASDIVRNPALKTTIAQKALKSLKPK